MLLTRGKKRKRRRIPAKGKKKEQGCLQNLGKKEWGGRKHIMPVREESGRGVDNLAARGGGGGVRPFCLKKGKNLSMKGKKRWGPFPQGKKKSNLLEERRNGKVLRKKKVICSDKWGE